MFAINRTANVPGRIIFLIDSITTIKGIKIEGVPWGTRWANICCIWLIHPNSIKLNQRGRANVKVRVRWLVDVKIYGNSPKKLLNKIIENNEINKKVLPWCLFSPNKVLNSLFNVKVILFHKIWYREGINQKVIGINIIPKIVLIQFNEKFIIVVEGSNTENKLVIIFSL